jgi:pimeloyl-ACP methyl ester carboxylesterase
VTTDPSEAVAAARPPIVLVHGAWAGAWVWSRVLAPLRAAGHDVHAVTLTGCGERRHALRRDITLQTHVTDVVDWIAAHELRHVVLVGHSYGGLVVTGAADRLLAADAAAVRRIVYVDAVLPRPGDAWSSHQSDAVRAERSAAARSTGLHALPPPDPAAFGLDGADRDWLLRRQGPHPFGAYLEPLHFDGARLARVPRAYVDCTAPAYPTIDPMRARARATPGMTVVGMATGHYPHLQAPRAFVDILLGLVG